MELFPKKGKKKKSTNTHTQSVQRPKQKHDQKPNKSTAAISISRRFFGKEKRRKEEAG